MSVKSGIFKCWTLNSHENYSSCKRILQSRFMNVWCKQNLPAILSSEEVACQPPARRFWDLRCSTVWEAFNGVNSYNCSYSWPEFNKSLPKELLRHKKYPGNMLDFTIQKQLSIQNLSVKWVPYIKWISPSLFCSIFSLIVCVFLMISHLKCN